MNYLINIFISALTAVTVLAVKPLVFPSELLVSVDVEQILAAQLEQISKSNLSSDDAELFIDRFGVEFDLVIKDLHKNKLVILQKQAVLSEIPDVTALVIEQLQRR